LLIGKTVQVVAALNTLFEDRAIAKTYMAVTIGSMDSAGIMDASIDGKPSKSEFEKLVSVPSPRFGALNLLRLIPHTGRRHQLRKHLAGIGNPILGDSEYSKEGVLLKGKGLYLHALSLQLEHPVTKRALKITAPLPKKFNKLFPEA
jgi:23S rRNA pseudouridine1911/1915/1917 synthase